MKMRILMCVFGALAVVGTAALRSSAAMPDGQRQAAPARGTGPATAALPKVVVYKDPSCGCCSLWMDHMRRAGFTVTAMDSSDMVAVHQMYRVPGNLQSCHLALVDGFVVEGHVPADDVKRLLRERPKVVGITVPGMPIGSPGMEQGGTKQPFKVLAFDQTGKTTVFAER